MPCIVAAVSWDGQLSDEIRAAVRTIYRLRQRPVGCSATEYESAAALICCATFDDTSGVHAIGDKVTAVFGEVVQPGLTVSVPDGAGPRLIARAAAEQGAKALRGLNGHYVALHWDEASQTLHALTDRLAGINLFVWDGPGYTVLASRLADLAAFPGFSADLDVQGVSDLMTLGCCVAGRTLLAGVERLEWASHVTWTRGTRRDQRYWDLHFDGPEQTKPLEHYADDLADLIREQVQLRSGHDLILPLSSGYDSRILAAACREVMEPEQLTSYTLGDRHAYDGLYAPEIARTLGIPHELIPIPPTFFTDFASAAVQRIDGMVIGHTCWRLAADPFLEKHRGRIVMNGWAGDQFQGSRLIEPMKQAPGLEHQFDVFYKNSPAWRVMNEDELARLFQPEVYSDTKGVARQTLCDAYVNAPADNPLQRLDFVNWTLTSPRRYQRMNRDYAETLCNTHQPFRENAIAQYLRTLPPATRYAGGIFKTMVERHWPHVARIPSSHGGVPIAAPWSTHQLHRAKGWFRYKAVPTVTLGRLRFPNPGTYVHYLDWLRGANRPFVEALLANSEYIEDIFDMNYVRTMVDDVMEGRSNDYGKIYNLASLILFRKQLGRRRIAVAA